MHTEWPSFKHPCTHICNLCAQQAAASSSSSAGPAGGALFEWTVDEERTPQHAALACASLYELARRKETLGVDTSLPSPSSPATTAAVAAPFTPPRGGSTRTQQQQQQGKRLSTRYASSSSASSSASESEDTSSCSSDSDDEEEEGDDVGKQRGRRRSAATRGREESSSFQFRQGGAWDKRFEDQAAVTVRALASRGLNILHVRRLAHLSVSAPG